MHLVLIRFVKRRMWHSTLLKSGRGTYNCSHLLRMPYTVLPTYPPNDDGPGFSTADPRASPKFFPNQQCKNSLHGSLSFFPLVKVQIPCRRIISLKQYSDLQSQHSRPGSASLITSFYGLPEETTQHRGKSAFEPDADHGYACMHSQGSRAECWVCGFFRVAV